MPTLPPPTEETILLTSQYPKDPTHVSRGVGIAVALHVLAALIVCLVAYFSGIESLRQLLEKGGAIAESGPAPEEPMTVELQLEEITPPPTPNPEFIKDVVKPKVAPPPVLVKKPDLPKPDKPKPHYTAPNATGAGRTTSVSAGIVGSSGLPHPSYPRAALLMHMGGTVQMEVTFDGGGTANVATILSSSGVSSLDSNTRDFILTHWHNAGLAGQTIHVPIIYDPGKSY